MIPTNMDRLTFAKYVATQEHVIKRQQTYGVLPYTHHLADVERLMRAFGVDDENLLVGAWLHDLVEDCEVKVKWVREVFGDVVADLVYAVTDEPGPNRKARKLATYEKTRTISGGVILKLFDRLANIQAGGALVSMYRKEHESFKRALLSSQPTELEGRLWTELDHCLFGAVPASPYAFAEAAQ